MTRAVQATKKIASVTDVSRQVGLSRSRFYELMEQGVFPKPLRHPTNNRPYYDESLQEECMIVRTTNVGVDGQPCLFYSRRRNGSSASRTTPVRSQQRDPRLEQLRHGLQQLGLTGVSDEPLLAALEESFPSGHENEPVPSVLMTVFRHLKAKNRGK